MALGLSYDWDREINTTDPAYYRWTQWIFRQLFDRGLAYQEEKPVWWCEALGTTLANEEVVDGLSDIGQHPCVRRPLRQWVLKITEYADELLAGLDSVEWPRSTKEMQRNWIGKSEGAEIDFAIVDHDELSLRVFTTRPDTLFGATYMVLAPEHPLVDGVTTKEQREDISAYVAAAAKKSELERGGTPEGQDRRFYRRVRHQSRHGQAHPDLGGGLCARKLWHRGHHGRSRSGRAGLGICRSLRAPHR